MSHDPKFIFQTSREFITAATEFYYAPTSGSYGRLIGRYLQLDLVDLPLSAQEYSSNVVKVAEAWRHHKEDLPHFDEYQNYILTFAAHINALLDRTCK